MSRLLCTADLHLHEWARFGDVDRLDDQAQVLDAIADLAAERKVDAIVIAGDIFHRPHPSPRTLQTFRTFARKVSELGIPMLAITGNSSHDIENADRYCALELFDDLVDVRRGPGTWTGAGVDVVCLPSVPMSNLVARTGGKDRDELHVEAAVLLLDTIEDELSHHRAMTSARGHELPTVVLAHWSVQGAAFPNGLPVDAAREPIIPIRDLEYCGADAVILGHIHKHQLLTVDPAEPNIPVFYCGSPLPLDHAEGGYEHGVVILDVGDPLTMAAEFVPIPSRPFVTLDLNVENWISNGYPLELAVDDGAIVRVKYRATQEQARRLDAKLIAAGLCDAGAALVTFAPEIVREDRARVEGLDEHLDDLAAVRLYNDAHGVEAPYDSELLDLTAGYLEAMPL